MGLAEENSLGTLGFWGGLMIKAALRWGLVGDGLLGNARIDVVPNFSSCLRCESTAARRTA